MRRVLAATWLAIVALGCGAVVRKDFSKQGGWNSGGGKFSQAKGKSARRMRGLELPLAFEPSEAAGRDGVEFEARGDWMAVGLGGDGLVVKFPAGGMAEREEATVRIGFKSKGTKAANLKWTARDRAAGETNYLVGKDPMKWRLRVPRYAKAEAEIFEGVRAAVYGDGGGLEYDLRVAPGSDVGALGLKVNGTEKVQLDGNGDLEILAAGRKLVMQRPEIFEERDEERGKEAKKHGSREKTEFLGSVSADNVSKTEAAEDGRERIRIDGGYVIRADGGIGFWVGAHDAGATIVIDPTLTLEYATLLGGVGGTEVNGAAADANGNLYVAGETQAGATFGGAAATTEGVAGGSTYLFVAKMNPGASGAASLKWLTFIGGSGSQAGGANALAAVLSKSGTGNVQIYVAGTTTAWSAASWKTGKRKWIGGGSSGLALFAFFAFGMAWFVRERRGIRLIGLAAAMAFALGIMASCGGGGSAATDPPGTLPGTYANAVTVTATYGTAAMGATRTAGLTLIVQ